MRRIFPVLTAAAILAACGTGRLKTGRHYPQGTVIEVEAADLVQAKTKAVASVLDLFLSDEAREGSAKKIRDRILSRPDLFTGRSESETLSSGAIQAKILVRYGRVRAELDSLGLIQEDLFGGKMPILVTFEDSPQASRASAALRAALERRGFLVKEQSSRGWAPRLVLRGRSRVKSLRDPRLTPLHPTRAHFSLRGTIHRPAGGRSGGPETFTMEQGASALDRTAQSARDRALKNAAERIGARIAGRWARGRPVLIQISGIEDMEEAKKVVKGLRTIPGVAGAALRRHTPAGTGFEVSSWKKVKDLARAVKRLRIAPLHPIVVRRGYLEFEVER